MLLIVLSLPFALFGLFLIVQFLLMKFSDEIQDLEIVGFQKRQNKGRALPVVRYEDGEGEIRLVEVRFIEEMGYLLSPPIERQKISVVDVQGKKPTVFGYCKLVSGLILVLPFLAAVGAEFDKTIFVGRVSFMLILIGVILVGWIVLKFIQRH